jgi:hypothetical protein
LITIYSGSVESSEHRSRPSADAIVGDLIAFFQNRSVRHPSLEYGITNVDNRFI